MFAAHLAKTSLLACLAVSLTFSFAFVQKAEAIESFLGKAISKYKKNSPKEKKMTIFNQQEREVEDIIPKSIPESDKEKYSFSHKHSFEQKGWNWKEVEDAVDFASKKTGVRREFLLGMLAVESDLGRNTGECSYEEVEKGAEDSYNKGRLNHRSWGTFKHRKSLIKGIADDLGYDYKELRVSCNPAQYTGTGGALGGPSVYARHLAGIQR